MKKKFLMIVSSIFFVLTLVFSNVSYNFTNNIIDINEGDIRYNNVYLTSNEVDENQVLPSKFDLRNVNGKNYVTPNKDQGEEGLCWAYATASLLETHDLIVKNKSYDNSAVLFSEKQLDYALSSNGIIGGNKVVDTNNQRELSSGSSLNSVEKLLTERLGGVQDTFNTDYSSIINYNLPLDPNVVFDRSKSLYEVDETVRFSNINQDLSNTELNEDMKNTIKRIIYENGGATVSIESTLGNTIKNILNGDDYLNITNPEYFTQTEDTRHALHLIGWDDDYEYGFCSGDTGTTNGKFVADNALYHDDNECGNFQVNGVSMDYVKVLGKGAWILKNSWGDDYSYVYLPYDSFIENLFTITKYSEKNWDDSNVLNKEVEYDYSAVKYIYNYNLDNSLLNEDNVVKLKMTIDNPTDIALYFSEDGDSNNLRLIGNYSFDSAGVKTINLQDKNLHVNENSFFQLDNSSVTTMTLFTTKNDNSEKAYTTDFIYSIDNEIPTKEKFLNIVVRTKLKNINDNEVIDYKLKNSNGEYLPSNAYSVILNKSYYSMVTPIIKLSEAYAKKGEYTLETWKDNKLLYSSAVNLNIDYLSIEGSGTNDDPWQIKNIRHFNMIRNAQNDNFILMNDLDFEYDTQNENGLFYNSGNGWEAIPYFKGNLDGNGKILKNIKTSNGIFEEAGGYGTCSHDKCGVHDLKVDNLIRNNCGQNTGGIINHIYLNDTYSYDFSNLSIVNSEFIVDNDDARYSQDPHVYIGGIVGYIYIRGELDLNQTVLKIDNWYSDYEYRVDEKYKWITNVYVGGLVGFIKSYNLPYISINNAKVNAMYYINKGEGINYYVSDIIGGLSELNTYISINNTIGSVNYEYNNNINVNPNAFIGCINSGDGTGDIRINGVKSTLEYTPNELINITNYEANLKPYELAHANYNNLYYYEDDYYVYDQYYDGTRKVEFKDRFNIYGDKIPTLKNYSENYSEYYDSYIIKVGETKSITDLIKNDTDYRKLKVYSSYECNLDVCNNITDETIISVPTEENGYTFHGLKTGTTTLIIYDELSGYLDYVTINVLPGEQNKLIDILKNNGYKVNNNYIYNFTLGDSITKIQNKLGADVIINSKVKLISTGTIIKKDNESYTVVIKGDTTGDGKMTVADVAKTYQYLKKKVEIDDASKEAGNVVGTETEIKINDVAKLYQFLKNKIDSLD